MIHKLVLKNFKRMEEEHFSFNKFDLIVGANNSGKSTVLQALGIWQYCVDQFRTIKKSGGRGIQIVKPDFTVLPVPEFNLLWTDKVSLRGNDEKQGKYVYIDISVYWLKEDGNEDFFSIQIRYQSPQSIYAIPVDGWANFNSKIEQKEFPNIVYVPPFSGLKSSEQWVDTGVIKQQVGKSHPGSILRNLLFNVVDRNDVPTDDNSDWKEIKDRVADWFGVELQVPKYIKGGINTDIKVEYKSQNGKYFDVIAGGSGFHQILTLLAFLYGYPEATTILLDEPDAHLHANLQRKIINYFIAQDKQFFIATHSEEFIKDVDIHSIISIMSNKPARIDSSEKVIKALTDVDNNDVLSTQRSPFILYVEGEDDDRILSSWSKVLNKSDAYQKYYPYVLGGSSKDLMKQLSDEHYTALKQIVPNLQRVLILDYDQDNSYHPDNKNNPCLKEWKRKNIDNYLLVPGAWRRAVANFFGDAEDSLLLNPYYEIINDFFVSQNLTLPPQSSWRNVSARIFRDIDGKKVLFEDPDSLFNLIKNFNKGVIINRQSVANAMIPDEIHQDVIDFFDSI
jgi:AAA15 family ATPase/GTPase